MSNLVGNLENSFFSRRDSFDDQQDIGRTVRFVVGVVVLRFYGPSTHSRSYRAWSVILTKRFPARFPKAVYQYLVHILSPVTDNFSSWNNGRRNELIIGLNLYEIMCQTWESISVSLASQGTSLSTELWHPIETTGKPTKWCLRSAMTQISFRPV